MSKNCKDFIEKLLIKDPKKRLGSKKDVKDVLAHPWFFDIDQKKLVNKQITPTFIPKFEKADGQVEYFDQKFVQSEAAISI